MPMTEKEIETLAGEVGEVDWSDPFYVDWLRTNLATVQQDEKRLKAAWRFHKILRADDQMEAALRDLRRTRQAIKTIEGLLEKGNE